MSQSSADKSATVNAAPDLQRVRSLFASPGRLAASAFLRREIARRMNERLDLIKFSPHSLLDAGCGDGIDLAMLQQRYPAARLFGIDASPAMLAVTRTRLQAMQPALKRLLARLLSSSSNVPRLMCGNFADLPLPGNSLGLLWSNLALHWHSQPQTAFAEWRRVLQTDGLLMFSCFGPDTFRELRQAFETADDLPHTLPFVDMHDLGDMLLGAGFSTPVMDMEMVTVTYDSPDKLLADVRAFGGNPLAARRRSLLGRHAHERFRQALEAQRDSNDKIPLTFEILYGHAFKPAPSITTEGEAIIRFAPRPPRNAPQIIKK